MKAFKQLKRQLLAIFVDACIIVNAYTLASLVLFARWAPLEYYNELLLFLPVAILVHCLLNYRFGLYRGIGRYTGINQGMKIVKSSVVAVVVLLAAALLLMPSSTLHVLVMVPIGGIIVFVLMAGVRFYPRVFYERSLREIVPNRNLLVVGAGEASEMIVRSIQKERHGVMNIVALVDDEPQLHGMEIHGVRIYDSSERISEIVKSQSIDEILIAIPSASLEDFQRIWRICSHTRLPVRTLRPLQSAQLGKVGINDIREVGIEDLLGRQPVETDYEQISSFFKGQVVLISGAGGSIGSELALQISQHAPSRLILVDHDESALYALHEKLSQLYFQGHNLYVADVKSSTKMESIIRRHKPSLVFHAAAYKHVPLMELQPDEAVLNNVQGTFNLADISGACGCACFVNISTDKAVEPVNIMGATKSLSEQVVTDLGTRYPDTKYCSVRFGNVLGSRGSVIPIFKEQITSGGPVTVTHPEMTRYFMLISEAVDLVLQAAAFPERNVVYVLEMGKPVRIVDLADQMIELMSPGERIELVFTGLRPGEKIHEQLIDKQESRKETDHPMIHRVHYPVEAKKSLLPALPDLFDSALQQDTKAIDSFFREWLPSFNPFDLSLVGYIAADSAATKYGNSGTQPLTMPVEMNYSWSGGGEEAGAVEPED